MCGIAGIVSSHLLTAGDRLDLSRINASLFHRGPDGDGTFISSDVRDGQQRGQVGLAMRRLAIIDVTAGNQPLYNEDASLALVANGEVYNYKRLRAELQARGHSFRTGSDCEVILHLYEELGDDCVLELRGMFAFALYDARRRKLLLARDRMGEKPLYYFRRGHRLYFASEAKALVKAQVLPFAVNPDAIFSYLHWGFVPETASAVQGVERLGAGHVMSVNVDTLDSSVRRYWDPRDAAAFVGDPVEALRAELDEVGKLVVTSDVPISIALSAGLDSSAIAALAVRYSTQELRAVTVGFAGYPRQDERIDARRFAQHLGIPLMELELTPRDAADVLPALCLATDEPLNDSAGSSIYLMIERVRAEGIKVMLTGLGGDELFWGYNWLKTALRMSERRRRAGSGTVGWLEYFDLEAPPRSYTQMLRWLNDLGGLRSGFRSLVNDKSLTNQLVFWDLNQSFEAAGAGVSGLFEPAWLRRVDRRGPFRPFQFERWPERLDLELMCLLFETYLRENGLAQSDRLSSANSVEVRTPLVDHKLVELSIGIWKAPAGSRGRSKETFANALKGVVPEWVTARKKRGFSNPWRSWCREISRQHALLLVDGALVQEGILRADRASEVAARIVPSGLGGYDSLAHGILRLELWARGFKGLGGVRGTAELGHFDGAVVG